MSPAQDGADGSNVGAQTKPPRTHQQRRVTVKGRLWSRIDPWIAAALACGLALRLYHLDAAPLWLDETETAIWSTLSPDQVAQTVFHRIALGRYDPRHLPLYFLIVNAWIHIVGFSPWLLRLPSVVFSAATIALTAAVGRELAGHYAARWAAWLAAISAFLIHHAQEARMYALLSALSALCILLLVRYVNGKSRYLGVAFVLVNCALLATHYYTVFLIAGELLVLLYLRRRPYRGWLFASLACALCAMLLSWIALFLTTQSSGEVYRIGLYSIPGVFWSMLSGYTLLPSSEELHAAGRAAIWPYLPYAIVGALLALVLSIAGWRALEPRARVVVALLLVCICLGPFLAMSLFPKISLNPRYFGAGVPLLVVVLAAAMPRRWASAWRIGSSVALVAVMGFAGALELIDPGQKREDIFAAGAWLDRNVPLYEEILVTSTEMASLAYYHWPRRAIRLYPARNVAATAGNIDSLVQGLSSLGGKRVIYLFGRSWLSDPENLLERTIRNRFTSCGGTAVRGIRIYCVLPNR